MWPFCCPRFHRPVARTADPQAPASTLGIRRLACSVDALDAVVAGLIERDTELIGEVVHVEDSDRLCSVRGPEGIIVMLAEPLG